ncbi:uncharacterized protein [Misgurnus anguillicaudatus]|uniref:uncharacterized protein n=1 Tax=Misgurnus anguillicaudatus TaxID=75329 RepID=UPI003CCF0AD7
MLCYVLVLKKNSVMLQNSVKVDLRMPRTKKSVRSQVAKKRMAEQMAAVAAEVVPPLKKMAQLTERCVYRSGNTKLFSNACTNGCANDFEQTSEQTSSLHDSNVNMNAIFDLFPQKSYISGSFHQGDPRYVDNYGKQCAVNSLTAILMCKMKSVSQLTTSDINSVLLHGDQFYSDMKAAGKISDLINGYMYVEELPDTHTLNDCTFTINYGTTLSGFFGVSRYEKSVCEVYMSLDKALTRVFQNCDACLVNVKRNICAAVKQGSWYAVFDPHSRNPDGTLACDGKSVVVFHRNMRSLCKHFKNLGVSMKADGTPFEVTGVNANMTDMPSVSVCSPVTQTNAEAEQEIKVEMEIDLSCKQYVVMESDKENSHLGEENVEERTTINTHVFVLSWLLVESCC